MTDPYTDGLAALANVDATFLLGMLVAAVVFVPVAWFFVRFFPDWEREEARVLWLMLEWDNEVPIRPTAIHEHVRGEMPLFRVHQVLFRLRNAGLITCERAGEPETLAGQPDNEYALTEEGAIAAIGNEIEDFLSSVERTN